MASANRIKSVLSIKSWRLLLGSLLQKKLLKSFHRFDGFKSIWFCMDWCAPLGSLDKLHVVPDCGTCFIVQTLCHALQGWNRRQQLQLWQGSRSWCLSDALTATPGCKNFRSVWHLWRLISCCEASRNPDLPYTLKPAVPPNTVQISTHKPNSLHPQWHHVVYNSSDT